MNDMKRVYHVQRPPRFLCALKWLGLCAALAATGTLAADLFVSPDGDQVPPFQDWANAAQSIQMAVDAAAAGDVIWVAAGVYGVGSTTNGEGRSRVTVDKAVSIRGATNREDVVILGSRGNSNTQVRCVWLGSNAILANVTLADGGAQNHPEWMPRGGGLYMRDGARADHCVIRNCIAEDGGGVAGPASSLLSNCWVEANTADHRGGGVLQAGSTHSIIQSNVAAYGGGINSGNASFCIIRKNHARAETGWAGGAAFGDDELSSWTALVNCLIVDNSVHADNYTAILSGELGAYNCTIANVEATTQWWMAASVDLANCLIHGGFGVEHCPMDTSLKTESAYTFANAAAGDFRPHPASPAIDAGSTTVMSPEDIAGKDFLGRPRVVGGQVDVGAFEFQGAADGAIPSAWLASYGLPTNQTANFRDDDDDRYNNWQEMIAHTDPTNEASRFGLSGIATDEDRNIWLAWPAITNRRYRLEVTASPASPWNVAAEIVVPTKGLFHYIVTNAPPLRFYRIGIDLIENP